MSQKLTVICGGSYTGKTTLANHLVDQLEGHKIIRYGSIVDGLTLPDLATLRADFANARLAPIPFVIVLDDITPYLKEITEFKDEEGRYLFDNIPSTMKVIVTTHVYNTLGRLKRAPCTFYATSLQAAAEHNKTITGLDNLDGIYTKVSRQLCMHNSPISKEYTWFKYDKESGKYTFGAFEESPGMPRIISNKDVLNEVITTHNEVDTVRKEIAELKQLILKLAGGV